MTFHRAIDVTADPAGAIGDLAKVGVQRILTSGGAQSAVDGVDVLRKLVQRAAGRVQIMAGGGVRTEHIPALAAAGVDAVHLSARRSVAGHPSGPGGGHPSHDATDVDVVRAAIAAARVSS